MTYLVSITTQGQISIPMAIRQEYAMQKFNKAVVYSLNNGQILVEPVRDLLSLKGAAFGGGKRVLTEARLAFEKYLGTRSQAK